MPDELQKPSPADDDAFLDTLLELDRGLTAQPQGERDAASVIAGPLAARRRPWRALTAVPSSSRDRYSSAPPLGEQATGPATGGAPGPALPPGRRRTQALAPALSYQTFYGFDEAPFGLSSDPKFLFRSASFEQATVSLADAIERREPVIVITGAKGTGKTTLCLSLIAQRDPSARATLLTHPPSTVDALLNATERASLIVADDADRWPTKMLDHLQGLSEGAREQNPQVVLVGEAVLLGRLRQRALRPLDRLVKTRCRLDPLTSDEVAAYVAHRLAVAGTGVRVEFDADAVARLHGLTGGVPRLINRLCDAALVAGHRVSASSIDRDLVAVAADDLHLARPVSRARTILRAVSMVLAFVALVLLGMGAAAWVFRDEVARVIIEWNTPAALPRVPDPPAQ